MIFRYINNIICWINVWYNANAERIRENEEKYELRLEEEGGLNINITKDCKNWITRKMNLLFNLISAKIKPG